jgi:hypothetical protein
VRLTAFRIAPIVASLAVLLATTQAHAQANAVQPDRTTLIKYCDHIDSVSAPTLAGIRDRTDCWKRVQLEGLNTALVDQRTQCVEHISTGYPIQRHAQA